MHHFSPLTTIPQLPSNLTNRELVAYVRHYFPDLQGPLRTMLDRFEGGIQPAVTAEPVDTCAENSTVKCPHCGTIGTLD